MSVIKKVFGRAQFYNRTSEYFENLETLMELLYKQRNENGLIEYIVVYGTTDDGKLYRSVFDFNSFSLEDLAVNDLQVHFRKFQKYLGEMLLEENIITQEQLKEALLEQNKSEYNERLGEILVRMGVLKNEDIINTLSKQLGLKKKE